MKKWLKENWFKVGILFVNAVLVIGLIITLSLFKIEKDGRDNLFQTNELEIQNKKLQLEQKNQEVILETKVQRDECLKDAKVWEEGALEAVCPGFSSAKTGETLSCGKRLDIGQVFDEIEKGVSEMEAECYAKYSPDFNLQ